MQFDDPCHDVRRGSGGVRRQQGDHPGVVTGDDEDPVFQRVGEVEALQAAQPRRVVLLRDDVAGPGIVVEGGSEDIGRGLEVVGRREAGDGGHVVVLRSDFGGVTPSAPESTMACSVVRWRANASRPAAVMPIQVRVRRPAASLRTVTSPASASTVRVWESVESLTSNRSARKRKSTSSRFRSAASRENLTGEWMSASSLLRGWLIAGNSRTGTPRSG